MILQSHDNFVYLLPALPNVWRDDSVTGLKARGGFIIDISWKGHNIEKAINIYMKRTLLFIALSLIITGIQAKTKGGDIRGDIHPEIWDALARAIKKADPNHLMTYHPRGRTTSATWFNDREWLDFNMYQSGHRRYGQRNGEGDYTVKENTEEDNWRYVETSQAMRPLKPVLDGEPSYEDIPQGLHHLDEPRWKDYDIRRIY